MWSWCFAFVQFENRLSALEVVALDQSGGFELGQHAVDRGQPDVLAGFHQALVDVLGRQMPVLAVLQHFQNLHPRQGDLETCLSEVLVLHVFLRCSCQSGG
jgi:hypothetical protein